MYSTLQQFIWEVTRGSCTNTFLDTAASLLKQGTSSYALVLFSTTKQNYTLVLFSSATSASIKMENQESKTITSKYTCLLGLSWACYPHRHAPQLPETKTELPQYHWIRQGKNIKMNLISIWIISHPMQLNDLTQWLHVDVNWSGESLKHWVIPQSRTLPLQQHQVNQYWRKEKNKNSTSCPTPDP